MDETTPLTGGNLSTVVQIGDTVRRSRRPWSDAVAALLQQLRSRGFDGSPQWIGFDTEGRETLAYIEGEAGFLPQMWTDVACQAAAKLLHRYHSAARITSQLAVQAWQYSYPDSSRHEVICHNDFAPYNLIFDASEPVGLIDFDMAGPGPVLRDVAMGAYWFTPLSFSGDWQERSENDIQSGHHRLRLFCHSYGIEPSLELLGMIAEWLDFMAEFPAVQVESGRTEYRVLIDQGHTAHWRREAEAFAEREGDLCESLLAV